MRIIKEGKIEKRSKEEFSFKCTNCFCEWEAERKEVKFTPPGLPYEVYMECPNCKKNMFGK